MSSLKEKETPTAYTFDDALNCAKRLGRSQGSWGRFVESLEALDTEERAAYSEALKQEGVTNDVDYVMALKG